MNSFLSFNKKLFTPNVNDYSVVKELNPSHTLFKVIHNSTQVPCVIRKINLINFDLKLLERENDINKLVDHPNIINIITSFIQEDFIYSIFPCAEYSSIDRLCKPFGLDETIISFVLGDILNAVDYLHRYNIIHRAIKGSNILIFGSLKTSIKFVLSGLKYNHNIKSIDLKPSDVKTFDYPKYATDLLNHLAPEILEQNTLGYDFHSDIYSIGILCCELGNGMVPFDNISNDEVLFYKVIGDIPKLLDASCEEIIIFNEFFDRLEMTLKRRYQVYSKKRFSSLFHDFTGKCLHVEPIQRPRASGLLEHLFIINGNDPKREKDRILIDWLKRTAAIEDCRS